MIISVGGKIIDENGNEISPRQLIERLDIPYICSHCNNGISCTDRSEGRAEYVFGKGYMHEGCASEHRDALDTDGTVYAVNPGIRF